MHKWRRQPSPSTPQLAKAKQGLHWKKKNAAQILHLSGLDVTVVKTDYKGQAKKLLELMENTDLIIVDGGDGMLKGVITGGLEEQMRLPSVRSPLASSRWDRPAI